MVHLFPLLDWQSSHVVVSLTGRKNHITSFSSFFFQGCSPTRHITMAEFFLNKDQDVHMLICPLFREKGMGWKLGSERVIFRSSVTQPTGRCVPHIAVGFMITEWQRHV